MRVRSALGVGLVVVGVTACRDLELPSPQNTQNPGPTLQFLTPTALADGGIPELGVQGFLALSAEDADGVASVDVTCEAPDAGATLAHMTLAPYQAGVNFGPCRAPGASPTALQTLTLRAVGTDSLGNTSAQSQTIQVNVNATTATLALDAPARVAPGKPFELRVSTDLPLQASPIVTVDGDSALFLDSTLDGGVGAYHYRVAAAPLLGADRWDAGAPPLNVLEEAERSVSVLVEAHAQTGNASQLAGQVLVSRVLWDQALSAPVVPVVTADSYINAVAGIGGLYVPLAAGPGFTPAFLAADTGAITLTPAASIPVTLPSRALDRAGHLVLSPAVSAAGGPFGSQVLDSRSGGILRSAVVLRTLGRPLYPVGNYVCEESLSQTGTTCGAAGSLVCLSATGELAVPVAASLYDSTGQPTVAVTSGNVLMLGFFGTAACATANGVRFLDVSAATPTLSPPHTGFPFTGTNLLRVFPVGDGTFYGTVFTTFQSTTRFDANNAAILPVTTTPLFQAVNINTNEILIARPDASLVSFRLVSPNTYFMSFVPSTGALSPATQIPIALDMGLTPGKTPLENAAIDSLGNLYFLMRRNGIASGDIDVVLSFDSALRARWIYHYPRSDTQASYKTQLLLDDAAGVVYLVDGLNSHATALAR